MRCWPLPALFLALVAALPARADTNAPSETAKSLSYSSGEQVETHLFGDWGGWRQRLKNLGVTLDLSYVGEAAWDVAGGKRQGGNYAGQENAAITLDLGKIAGLQGLEAHIDFVNRNGRNASTDYVGDSLYQVQEIYGSGGDVLVHLVSAYLSQSLDKGVVKLSAGRLPMEDQFGELPVACDFMSLTVCSTRGLGADSDFSSFPRATWGGSAFVKTSGQVKLGIGLFEVNPTEGGPSGFDWSVSGATGVIVPVQLTWTPHLGPQGMPGDYIFGAFGDSSQLQDWQGAPSGPTTQSRRAGFYVLAQQQLTHTGTVPGEGLTGLAGYVYNSPATSLFQNFAFVGLLDQGLIPGRPRDRAGLSFAYGRVSNDLTAAQMLEAELGAPLSNGAPAVQTDEMLLEANYDFVTGFGVEFMPNIQWDIRPDATSAYPNAVVLGLQVKAQF